MPQITRDDGQKFIIPSYRDSLVVKKAALFKRELSALSSSYGEYVNLRKTSASRYEVAFSKEPGPLLGETVLDYFNNPQDLIYCEKLANAEEAILVIVKNGSVYLDGMFALENISDELVTFLTKESNFEIYIYGNVPISKDPEEGKFSFDSKAVKSFEVLKEPVFDKLPALRKYDLQLLDVVLKEQKIGVFPADKLILILGILALLFGGWWLINKLISEEVVPMIVTRTYDPYSDYKQQLQSPDPNLELNQLIQKIVLFYTIPGWSVTNIDYQNNILSADLKSEGARTSSLFEWAKKNNGSIIVNPNGFKLKFNIYNLNRSKTKVIYSFNDVIGTLVDRLSYVLPGTSLSIARITQQQDITTGDLKVTFANITPATFYLLSDQFKQLPLVISKVTVTIRNDKISGTIDIKALGN